MGKTQDYVATSACTIPLGHSSRYIPEGGIVSAEKPPNKHFKLSVEAPESVKEASLGLAQLNRMNNTQIVAHVRHKYGINLSLGQSRQTLLIEVEEIVTGKKGKMQAAGRQGQAPIPEDKPFKALTNEERERLTVKEIAAKAERMYGVKLRAVGVTKATVISKALQAEAKAIEEMADL